MAPRSDRLLEGVLGGQVASKLIPDYHTEWLRHPKSIGQEQGMGHGLRDRVSRVSKSLAGPTQNLRAYLRIRKGGETRRMTPCRDGTGQRYS